MVETTYPSLETAPTPRPVRSELVSTTNEKPDDWDFLSPGGPIPQLPPKPPPPKLHSRDPKANAQVID